MAEELKVDKIIEKMELIAICPDIDTSDKIVTIPDINRPALQLAGFFDHFDSDRVQVIGRVEAAYLETLDRETKLSRYEQLLSCNVPCIVYCRGLEADTEMVEMARKYQIPLLKTTKQTSSFEAEIIRWMKVMLAPCISIHGVLVDVYGEGVLITGESGIGKSEAALELIKRGHRLVTDDVVEIRKVSDVKAAQGIDMVIHLEDWDKEKEYDRFGLEEEYTEILGNKVVCHNLPVRPGRNLAVIVESAAVNWRQKKMGYNAAQELYNRVQNSINRR